ncbi:MAG: hypothetical protein JWO81_3066 [Alphaproteobacteria bacterium]|nr:hypothetical protein [Alphaproteobacteria bacterium]
MRSAPALFTLRGLPALELALRDAEGAPWVLSLSPGMERFIGAYARINGFGGDGPLLLFRPAGQTA